MAIEHLRLHDVSHAPADAAKEAEADVLLYAPG